MPAPRQRQHRRLVRHRQYLRQRMTSVRCKIRHILSDYNADRKDLFSTQCGPAYFNKEIALSDADRFVIKQLWSEWQDHQSRILALTKKIKAFIVKAPNREKETRAILKTAPGVGFVTAQVIVSEVGDVSRFRNAKAICAYAGLVPTVRQTGRSSWAGTLVLSSFHCLTFSSRGELSPEPLRLTHPARARRNSGSATRYRPRALSNPARLPTPRAVWRLHGPRDDSQAARAWLQSGSASA